MLLTVPPPDGGAAYTDVPCDAGTQSLFFTTGPAVKVGGDAPLFDVKGIDGKPIRLADFRGRHVLVSFWMRGCDWMMPAIRDVDERFSKNGKLAVIQFNMDPAPRRIDDYLKRHKTPGVHALIGAFYESQVQVDYFQEGCLQQVFLIGPDGKLLAKDLTAENLATKVAEAIGTR
ncbi:MAG: redoxin domain-containing protein [Planctomycetes bacterium]|nr:redoxin domain-containing protein [Planctomycetota bacterium]